MELLYQYLMRGLIAQGNQRGAIIVYEDMSNLLFSNFGIMPSDETKAVYREAVQTINERAISLGTLREQLKEPGTASGALFCDYDFFKIIYHAEARAVARNGDAVHIGLLSLTDESGEELPKRSLERCMEPIGEFYSKWKAIEAMERGEVAIISCGTGNPYFTTDTAAALRACEINAQAMLKATQVDGVYDSDPRTNPNAKRFEVITHKEVLEKELHVMDSTAAALLKDNGMPIIVFNLHKQGNIARVLRGENIGTIVQ